ncbi:Hypothetical_protein [Hexamita inflata]|uniref:Hypothetical_protein n=1 Tax=Hexamita inflata TaxID=28002 RepID=A0AA86PTM0_9EUKA|nr:Hypothetical protein HINF_LOCUS33619 [Hexamita inflata]
MLFMLSLTQVCDKKSKYTGLQYICGENTACDSNYNCIRDSDQTKCNNLCAAARNSARTCTKINIFHMDTYPYLDNPQTEQSVYHCPSTKIYAPRMKTQDINWDGDTMLQHYIAIPICIVICSMLHIYCFQQRADLYQKNIREQNKRAFNLAIRAEAINTQHIIENNDVSSNINDK